MLKKTISYKDWDGNPVSGDFYFNLTEAELMELEMSEDGDGFADTIKKAIEKGSGKQVLDAFKRMITLSIGKRVDNRFVKSDEVKAEFMETGAYSALFMELATDAEAGAAFITGLMPNEIADQVKKEKIVEDMKARILEQAASDAVAEAALETAVEKATPVWPTAEPTTPGPETDFPEADIVRPTDKELSNMTTDEFMVWQQSHRL